MNNFQRCQNTADLVPLYIPQQLYLKPISRINISLQLPNLKKTNKSISHREIMEKLRELIEPEKFTVIKVIKTTVEFVRFEAEVESKTKVDLVITKIDNRMIKLKDFSEFMRVKAAKAKLHHPTRQEWDEYFHNERVRNQKTCGEADTVHLSKLPTKWFVSHRSAFIGENESSVLPSEKLFYRIFEKFGRIKNVDIPICDPYRKHMKDHITGIQNSSFDQTDFFEGYIQYKDYIGFTSAMDALCGMKLVYKGSNDDEVLETDVVVDYDRTKHLSSGTIRRREIVRERLIKKAKEKEEKERQELEDKRKQEDLERMKELDLKTEKEQRRKIREEKRKVQVLEKLKITGSDEINEKIEREEKKLLCVQRKLEAIRLIEELFKRIKEKHREEGLSKSESNAGYEELKLFKDSSELAVQYQKEKLYSAIRGRAVLKSILSSDRHRRRSSSSSSLSLDEDTNERKSKPINSIPYDPSWLGIPYHLSPGILYPPSNMYPSPHFDNSYAGPSSRGGAYPRRGRSYSRFRGTGYRNRRNNWMMNPDVKQEYQRYFMKFLDVQTNRRKRNRSSERSRSRSRSRPRPRRRSSYSRSRSKSCSSSSNKRSRTRSRSRSRSRSGSRDSHYRSRRRSSYKSRSRSRRSSRKGKSDRSDSSLKEERRKEKSRSKSWSSPTYNDRSRKCEKST